jgi:fructose 1,6-bisphosphatase
MQEYQQTRAQRFHIELLALIQSRQHELVADVYVLVADVYVNASSSITILCLIHGQTYTTTATNYKRCKTGLPCCGKINQSIATAFHNTLRQSKKEEDCN